MVERRGLQLLRSGNVNIHFIFIGLKGKSAIVKCKLHQRQKQLTKCRLFVTKDSQEVYANLNLSPAARA